MLRSTKSTSSSLILSHLLPSTSIVQRLPSTSRFYAATKSSGTKTPKGSTNSSSSKKKESTSRGSGKAEVGTGDARLETIRKVKLIFFHLILLSLPRLFDQISLTLHLILFLSGILFIFMTSLIIDPATMPPAN